MDEGGTKAQETEDVAQKWRKRKKQWRTWHKSRFGAKVKEDS